MTTVHGGLDPAELRSLGLQADQVLDFSANINPLGPSRRVIQAAAEADLSAYPDRNSLGLREALAARLNIAIDKLMIGNGSTELIHLVARACLRPGEKCLTFTPTFGEYEAAAAIAGADVHTLRAREERGFRWHVDTAVRTIREMRPGVVFLCNPNNPTGAYLERDTVEQFSSAVGDGALLVLDNAYAELSDSRWDPLPLLGSGNLVILNSMTKDHALAGVRLGYMVAEPSFVAAVRRLQPAWSVNAVAQAVGIAALEDEAYVARAREVIREAKVYLYRELEKLRVTVAHSTTNFILARVGDAASVRRALLRRRIAVRDCTSFGLPEHIRIAARRPEECARLINSLRDVLDR